HRDALDYIGGVPVRIVPDNASTATNQVARGATVREVNERYQLFAEFYGCGITPARPGKPRDKAHVEKAVDIVQTWVVEALAGHEFATFEALNAAIAAQVDWINDREGFRGRKTTRRQLFMESEAETLRPLPQQRWSYSTWRTAKAGVNYHVQVEKHFYSVPWSFAGKRVDVQIFGGCQEVCV
ncbi:Mu transposase domain-containing protein, partial [Corynebacterium jeddahense]